MEPLLRLDWREEVNNVAHEPRRAPGAHRSGAVDLALELAGVMARAESPGILAMVRTLVEPTTAAEVRGALRLLAWERSNHGSGHLDSLLADLDTLWDALKPGDRAPVERGTARRCAVDAWVDAVAAAQGAPSIDPLSGLHTSNYLVGRVHELDRAAAGSEPPPLVLLAVRWHEPTSPWLRIATVLRVADALTVHVRTSATLCQAGAGAALALVPDDSLSRHERTAVERELIADPLASAGLAVDIIPVLDRRDALPVLIDRIRNAAT